MHALEGESKVLQPPPMHPKCYMGRLQHSRRPKHGRLIQGNVGDARRVETYSSSAKTAARATHIVFETTEIKALSLIRLRGQCHKSVAVRGKTASFSRRHYNRKKQVVRNATRLLHGSLNLVLRGRQVVRNATRLLPPRRIRSLWFSKPGQCSQVAAQRDPVPCLLYTSPIPRHP